MTGFPDWLEPMAATLTQERFTGPEWIFERKFDGIRLLAFKNGSDVRLLSRNRLPLNSSHPSVVQAIANEQSSSDAVPWLGFFSPITLIDGVQTAFLGAISAFPGGHGPSDGQGALYVLVVLGLIAGSYGLLMRRYRKVGL